MKLCFLAAADNIHSYRWIHYFANHGHEVAWISLVPGSFAQIPGVHYHELGNGHDPLTVLRAVPGIRRVLRDFRPDVLHVHSVGSYGVSGLLSGYSPMVATPWGSDVIYGKHSPFNRWFIQPFTTAPIKSRHFIQAERIVQREHGHGVIHLTKCRQGSAAYALCG